MHPGEAIQNQVIRADYANPVHADALVMLLNAYAEDPMGGGKSLSKFAQENLITALAARTQAFSILAFSGEKPVGLVNCFEGFSTFACRPLINVHDVAVLRQFRGQGLARNMLGLVETIARERGACKLTLEVLQGNSGAIHLYETLGFAAYQLDPAMGQACFLQKLIG